MRTQASFLSACSGMLLLLMLCTSCGESHLAHTSRAYDDACWAMTDTLDLVYHSTDTQKVHTLYFPITFTDDYPNSNLYLRAIVRSPSGDENVLPARFDLMDAAGEWMGEPSGDEVELELNIGDGLRFNQEGDYTIRLFHFMRDTELCGVRKVGIVLDESQQK
ncbi:MAG: gliding motility lipoprotein GldH [Bacteroidota bacterium]